MARMLSRARVLDGYLLYIGAATLIASLHYLRMRSAWIFGSWLINFAGGFVRRGLLGEGLLRFSRLLHVPVLYATAMLQGLCFLCIFLTFRRLCVRSNWSPAVWAFVLCPATLAFAVFDSSVAFRQEILLLALVGLAIWMVERVRSAVVLSLALCVGSSLVLLSHEGLICYLPYLLAVVFLGVPQWKRALWIAVPVIVGSAVCTAVALRHSGDAAVMHAVCEALGNPREVHVSGVCDGSIAALAMDKRGYAGQVTWLLHTPGMVRDYVFTGLLCLLPAVLAVWELWRRPEARRDVAIAGIAFGFAALGSVELFAVAIDWARWMYIHVFCLAFLLIWVNARECARDKTWTGRWQRVPSWVTGVALFLYATLWNVPYFPSRDMNGYFTVVHRLFRG